MPNYIPPATGGGSATWGGITGTLSAQTDLDNALDAKADASALSDATNLGPGTVNNTEMGYLDGLSSNAQDQLDNKQPLDALLTLLAALSLTGQADKFLGVNATEDALEFKDDPAGSGVEYAASSSGTEGVVQAPDSVGDLADTILQKSASTWGMSFVRTLGSKELEVLVESASTALDFKNVYGELRQAATAVMRFYASNVRFGRRVGVQQGGVFFDPDRTFEVRDASNPPIRISNTVQTMDLGVNASSQLEANGDVVLTDAMLGTTVQAYDAQLASIAGLSYSSNGNKLVAVNDGETSFELVDPIATPHGDTVSLTFQTPGTNGIYYFEDGDGVFTSGAFGNLYLLGFSPGQVLKIGSGSAFTDAPLLGSIEALSLTGQAGKVLAVNGTEDGFELVTP